MSLKMEMMENQRASPVMWTIPIGSNQAWMRRKLKGTIFEGTIDTGAGQTYLQKEEVATSWKVHLGLQVKGVGGFTAS